MIEIDKTATCRICGCQLEHYAGVPGSKYMTPYWRHADATAPPDLHGGADPDPDTIRQVDER